MATVKVHGREATPVEREAFLRSAFHRPESKDHGIVVGVDREGGREVQIPDALPDDLVELHLDDGSVVVTDYAWLRERIGLTAAQRGADPDRIPSFLDLNGTERGAGTVALHLLQ